LADAGNFAKPVLVFAPGNAVSAGAAGAAGAADAADAAGGDA
jgi:hypothetical protein